jgi:hypothetical protein
MSKVTIKQVITVDELNRYNGLNVWGRTIECCAGDNQINIACTDEQLIQLRDRLMDKYPIEDEEEVVNLD